MYTPADRYTQTIMASTHRPIGSQIGLLETNERTVSDWPCSRMTGNNPCTYVRTFSSYNYIMLQIQKPVWKSHFIPEIYDGSRIKRGGGGGGVGYSGI